MNFDADYNEQLMESAWSYLNAFDVTSVNLKQNSKEPQPTYAHISLLNSPKPQRKQQH